MVVVRAKKHHHTSTPRKPVDHRLEALVNRCRRVLNATGMWCRKGCQRAGSFTGFPIRACDNKIVSIYIESGSTLQKAFVESTNNAAAI
jgi:hypothetical protein